MSYQLQYWPLKAKNVATALALEIAGEKWESAGGPGAIGDKDLVANWGKMKPDTVWQFLPNLKTPNGKTVGSELAMLQLLAEKHPQLKGADEDSYWASQELLHQSEELYQKLTSNCPTAFAKDKDPEKFKAFWTGADPNTHSASQGLLVYLDQFEKFMTKCGKGSDKYTDSGVTIGELKLYATLYKVRLIQEGIPFKANVAAFMKRLDGNAQVREVIDNKLKDCIQYFIAPEGHQFNGGYNA